MLRAIAGDADVLPVVRLPEQADPAPASSPEPDGTALPEIVVTATKRPKRQRDIPGSVDVVRGEDLEQMRAQSLGDYIKQVPGVVYLDRGGDAGLPIIRGISASAGPIYSSATQLTVGIYVDDLPFSDVYLPYSQPDLNPFDLQRLEILKGPQGTLFGSGALAGGIRYVLQKPKLAQWEAKLDQTIRSTLFSDGLSPVTAGAVNIPIGSEAAFRATGVARRASGLIDESGRGKDVDPLRQYTGRALTKWNPAERLELSAFYFRQHSDQPDTSNADNPRGFDRELTGVTEYVSAFSGGNLSARYAFDGADLLSSSNLIGKHVEIASEVPVGSAPPNGDADGDGGDNGPGSEDAGVTDMLAALVTSNTHTLFQELRLSSPAGDAWKPWSWMGVEWIVGAAYQRAKQDVLQRADVSAIRDTLPGIIDALPLLPIQTPLGPIYGTRNISVAYAQLHSVATETALFGETTTKFGEHWEATLGGRGFWTTLKVDGFQADAQTIVLQGGETQSDIHRIVRASGFNPRIALRYLFNRNVQLYGLASKGYQFGGIQINAPTVVATTSAPEAFVPYRSSNLWNYEFGLRTEFLDRRLRFDITAFYLDWKDLQISVRKPLAPGGGLSIGLVENIGHAKSQGVESALSFTLARGIDFVTSLAWMKAVTTEGFDSTTGLVPAGTRLPASPRFQCSNVLSLTAPFSLFGKWELSGKLIHAHIGSSYNDLHSYRRQGGYDTLDASLAVKNATTRLQPDLTVSLLNATDARGVTAIDGSSGQREVGYYFTRPRTLLLSLGLRY